MRRFLRFQQFVCAKLKCAWGGVVLAGAQPSGHAGFSPFAIVCSLEFFLLSLSSLGEAFECVRERACALRPSRMAP
jgi:hypothetical protein